MAVPDDGDGEVRHVALWMCMSLLRQKRDGANGEGKGGSASTAGEPAGRGGSPLMRCKGDGGGKWGLPQALSSVTACSYSHSIGLSFCFPSSSKGGVEGRHALRNMQRRREKRGYEIRL